MVEVPIGGERVDARAGGRSEIRRPAEGALVRAAARPVANRPPGRGPPGQFAPESANPDPHRKEPCR
ncbi:hypothetical protein D5S19_14560 [Amycolatopsis panacis]|uniref:Uncharacterized protein n=1 Tax=Amycolatopsis panacis TaxID=2340917 RepID=A0A419I4C4_9PSEU|nr:hypothetical protein D5S19_14560 [Amycolatopsis panacis]